MLLAPLRANAWLRWWVNAWVNRWSQPGNLVVRSLWCSVSGFLLLQLVNWISFLLYGEVFYVDLEQGLRRLLFLFRYKNCFICVFLDHMTAIHVTIIRLVVLLLALWKVHLRLLNPWLAHQIFYLIFAKILLHTQYLPWLLLTLLEFFKYIFDDNLLVLLLFLLSYFFQQRPLKFSVCLLLRFWWEISLLAGDALSHLVELVVVSKLFYLVSQVVLLAQLVKFQYSVEFVIFSSTQWESTGLLLHDGWFGCFYFCLLVLLLLYKLLQLVIDFLRVPLGHALTSWGECKFINTCCFDLLHVKRLC